MKTVKPKQLTPSQRRAEIVDLLARGVVRMHQRGLIHNMSRRLGPEVNGLDLSGEMPLSVSERPHELTPGDLDHA
jgi:hypothetical protein